MLVYCVCVRETNKNPWNKIEKIYLIIIRIIKKSKRDEFESNECFVFDCFVVSLANKIGIQKIEEK